MHMGKMSDFVLDMYILVYNVTQKESCFLTGSDNLDKSLYSSQTCLLR